MTIKGVQSYALTKKPEIYISLIKQFWRTDEAFTDADGEVSSTASIDGQSKTITEASLRRHLKLEDHDGITSIPNSEIFKQLALMGITSSPSLSSEPSTEPTIEPQPSPATEYHVPTPNESPLYAVQSHGSTKDSLKLNELTNLVTKLSEIIEVLEDDLKKPKQTYKDEEDDFSKQGRKLSDIDEEPNTYFAQDDEVDIEVVHDQDTDEEGQPEDSTAGITVSTAPISFSTARESYSTADRVYGRRSKHARKDKGKAIMIEIDPEKKSKKLFEQERLGLEKAIKLQEKIDEDERAQVARDKEIARQLLALDEERVTTDPKTTKDIDWNDPSVQKYWDLKNKPKSEAQARKNMIVYLKNQSNYKMKDFEGIGYAEIRPIFENIEKEQVEKDTTGKRKKSLPRKRTRSTTKRQKVELDDEKEDLKGYLDIVPREGVAEDVESLSTKYPIVDWKTYTLSENFMYYKIIRGDGSSKNYKILSEMLYDFDRQDIMELYRLVKERYSSSKPEGYDLMLWGDLHTLFEPDEESEI
ncbi:hypothetical protein Tco_1082639 [Tanacetum coccineum]|uniref:Uncharacterized protein n=1 Tax=Tanacetum coccineum TaxID=301880 RepID=A0ABQ5I292_9ASTR